MQPAHLHGGCSARAIRSPLSSITPMLPMHLVHNPPSVQKWCFISAPPLPKFPRQKTAYAITLIDPAPSRLAYLLRCSSRRSLHRIPRKTDARQIRLAAKTRSSAYQRGSPLLSGIDVGFHHAQ
eukprot:CAMPEP_0206594792 /NCGR_PEP_ID=MMETSP0325_2-20121206/42620_1 /ASSEMBLY_ACC=CAM_ASM_000347 /TAXON_ID=2866 /ORGANISM="Crypthecodinium cohnii, Strain Seligo" /LENGTH=123 /DNA_ID=CAMNT_0054105391 /DNA_START=1 /DNA_END=369 /DNA_ORIENTATION=+